MIPAREKKGTLTKVCVVYGIRTANRKGGNMQRLYKLMEEWSQIMETGQHDISK